MRPLLALLLTATLAASEARPWEPSQGTADWFMPMHRGHLAQAAKGDAEIVLFGDSLTQFWERHPAILADLVGTRRAVNFGIGGDRTQEMLWRIGDGLFTPLEPSVIVLLAGANNWRDPAEDTARGIGAVVAALRAACPSSRILLLGMLPSQQTHTPYRDHIARINRTIAALDDGDRVRFLDFGAKLINPDGTISTEVQYDFLHLDAEGYRIWARETAPHLTELLAK